MKLIFNNGLCCILFAASSKAENTGQHAAGVDPSCEGNAHHTVWKGHYTCWSLYVWHLYRARLAASSLYPELGCFPGLAPNITLTLTLTLLNVHLWPSTRTAASNLQPLLLYLFVLLPTSHCLLTCISIEHLLEFRAMCSFYNKNIVRLNDYWQPHHLARKKVNFCAELTNLKSSAASAEHKMSGQNQLIVRRCNRQHGSYLLS